MSVNNLKIFTLLLSLFSSLESLADPNFADLDKSVVRILNKTATGGGTGTGFVINNQHQVATNYHVIAEHSQLWVADGGADRTHLKAAQVLFQSEERDLAILSVPNLERPPLTLASVEPTKGAQVYAIGFPGAADLLTGQLSTESSVTNGSISRVIDAAWSGRATTFRVVQHSAEINGGNSGGPLVNACGQVVGINTVKTSLAASVESGEIISGVFFASHISSLIDILRAQQIPFTEVNTACTSSANTTTGFLNLAMGLIAVILAILAVTVSLTRPRQQLVQTIETYTQWLHRAGKNISPPPSPKNGSTGDWILSGQDLSGQPIQLVINESLLQQTLRGLTIGRSSKSCDLVIENDTLSRHHAKLSYKNGHLYIEDTHSANGTQIDGTRLKPFQAVLLTVGQTVTLGEVKLWVKRNSSTFPN